MGFLIGFRVWNTASEVRVNAYSSERGLGASRMLLKEPLLAVPIPPAKLFP